MSRLAFGTLLVFGCTAIAGAQSPAKVTIRLGEHNFTLPAGFTARRAAAAPLTNQ